MTDEEPEGEESDRAPLVERLLPPVDQHGDDGSLKPSRMTPREQLVAAGLGVANVAVTGVIASAVTRQQVLVLLAGLVASVLIVVGARVGHRLVALAGLFTSTLLSGQILFVLALPFYAGAFWILLKFNRQTKAHAALKRQQRAEQRGSIGKAPRPGRTQGQSKGKGKGGPAATAGKAPPPKSKRYTPPKVQKKRPPPPPSKPPRDRSIVD